MSRLMCCNVVRFYMFEMRNLGTKIHPKVTLSRGKPLLIGQVKKSGLLGKR